MTGQSSLWCSLLHLVQNVLNVQLHTFYVLWGKLFLQALLLQRSGMVFVPSIISEPQNSQMRPVGFDFIINLHAG